MLASTHSTGVVCEYAMIPSFEGARHLKMVCIYPLPPLYISGNIHSCIHANYNSPPNLKLKLRLWMTPSIVFYDLSMVPLIININIIINTNRYLIFLSMVVGTYR
jgi:hypothetical protein